MDLDPEEALRTRTKQKAYLARYGRMDWFAWENREVTELDEATRAISEILEKEQEAGEVGGVEDLR